MNPRSLRIVFLDFDGVIIESAIVKKKAYRKLFEIFPGHRKEIETYQEKRGGLPRRRQFEEIHDRILGRKISVEETDDLERKYVALMLEEVLKAPFVTDAEEFLRDFQDRLDLYLVSATPEDATHPSSAAESQIMSKGSSGRFFRCSVQSRG